MKRREGGGSGKKGKKRGRQEDDESSRFVVSPSAFLFALRSSPPNPLFLHEESAPTMVLFPDDVRRSKRETSRCRMGISGEAKWRGTFT